MGHSINEIYVHGLCQNANEFSTCLKRHHNEWIKGDAAPVSVTLCRLHGSSAV